MKTKKYFRSLAVTLGMVHIVTNYPNVFTLSRAEIIAEEKMLNMQTLLMLTMTKICSKTAHLLQMYFFHLLFSELKHTILLNILLLSARMHVRLLVSLF